MDGLSIEFDRKRLQYGVTDEDLFAMNDQELEDLIKVLLKNRKPKKLRTKKTNALESIEFRHRLQNRLRSKGIKAGLNVVGLFIKCMLDEITCCLYEGKTVNLRNIGSFYPRLHFKVTRHPITKVIIQSEPRAVPYFRYSSDLRNRLVELWKTKYPVTEEMMPLWFLKRVIRSCIERNREARKGIKPKVWKRKGEETLSLIEGMDD